MRISMSRTNLSQMDLLSKSPLNCQSLRHTLDSNFGMTGSKTERLKLCFDFELSKGNRGRSSSPARARAPEAKANPGTDLPRYPIHPLTQTLVRRLMGMEALKIKAAHPEVKTLT